MKFFYSGFSFQVVNNSQWTEHKSNKISNQKNKTFGKKMTCLKYFKNNLPHMYKLNFLDLKYYLILSQPTVNFFNEKEKYHICLVLISLFAVV